MSGYTKLFGSILESTVWMEPPPIKVVWITMLAMADRDGHVEASVPGLAKRAGVERAQCEQALAIFLAPDPDSRTQEFDGRRIQEIPGGWRLLNYETYRERASQEEAKEKAAERKRRQRERHARSRSVTLSHAPSRDVAPVPLGHAIAEAEAEADPEKKNVRTRATDEPLDEAFAVFANAYPTGRRQGGYLVQQSYVAAASKVGPEVLLRAVEQHKRSKQWRVDKVIPNMTTWLREERWTQVLPEPEAVGMNPKTAGNADALRRFVERHS